MTYPHDGDLPQPEDQHDPYDVAEHSNDITEQSSKDEQGIETQSLPIHYETLTLMEVIVLWAKAPLTTWRGIVPILTNQSQPSMGAKSADTTADTDEKEPVRSDAYTNPSAGTSSFMVANAIADTTDHPSNDATTVMLRRWVGDVRIVQLGLYISAFLVTWWGTGIMVSGGARSRTIDDEFTRAVPFVILGMLLWALSDFVANSSFLHQWWASRTSLQRFWVAIRSIPVAMVALGLIVILTSIDESPDDVLVVAAPGIQLLLLAVMGWFMIDVVQFFQRRRQRMILRGDLQVDSTHLYDGQLLDVPSATITTDPDELADDDFVEPLAWYMRIHPLRVFGALIAGFLTLMVWVGTANNEMPTLVFYLWLLSIGLWMLILAPLDFNVLRWSQQKVSRLTQSQPLQWMQHHRWEILVFVIFLVFATSFRLSNLNGNAALGTAVPPEMTSDHVEKILDSQRVLEGSRNIFFANNGGREPIQMYLMAMFSQLPGQGMNFESLKLLAVIESLLTLPFFFWFGREVIGFRDKRLGVIVGLLLVGLIAVSYWHVTITRLALRIVLTPLVASLLMIYLIRGLRDNQRGDFIKAGAILGFGLYTYQAVRMLPVVIVVAIVIALYFVAQRWRDRWTYIFNLSTLVFISFMIFLPLFHYSVENPEQFWRRTTGRLLGDDVVEETLADGSVIEREASITERFEAFNENVPILMSNIRNVLLMFNWKGDVGWINGFSNYPVLDPMTGALFLLGLMAWLTWMIRYRHAVYWLIPLALLIMLLPSALSIAFPIENPSNTRTSGALPMVYLIATLPLALIVVRLLDILPRTSGRIAVSFACGVVILGANAVNTNIYFNDFRDLYVASSLPYDDAGRVLQGFAISDGAYGNAFMIAYPFWWDHRALAIESGRPDWNNGILSVADVPQYLLDAYSRNDRYKFDPERDILFFFNKDDTETRTQLREWFPDGREILYPTYHENDEFSLYRIPVLGEAVFLDFATRNLVKDNSSG